jgi:hypothetical protein
MPRRGIGPSALVVGVVVATWLISGVTPADIVRFLGYEMGFVALPGAALLWALRGRRSGFLVTIALAWPLGQTLEILAFSASAAAGLRSLYFLYPLIVIVGSAAVIRRRKPALQPDQNHDSMSSALMWTAAVALSLGLIYLAFMFLPQVPMPSTTESVAYSPDFPFFIGLIAEVLNHWPAGSPGLSGAPLHYEWFVFFHMAAIAQVGHVSIPTIALRLDYAPTMVVLGCQLLMVGRFFTRAAWSGVIAIVVVFLLGPLDLTTDVGGSTPFFDRFSTHLWASWTFPFGLMFFLALLYLIGERLRATTWRTRDDLWSWIGIGLLMVGASGAKATILPVIIAGTGLYVVVLSLTKRGVPASALVTFVLGIVIFAVTFVVVYGGGVPGTAVQPLVSLARTAPVIFVTGIASPLVRTVLLPFAYLAGLAGILLPLAGTLYLLRREHRPEIAPLALCLCMFVGGLTVASVVHQGGYSELYFLDTGYVAGCIPAAAGLRFAWLDAGRSLPISRRGVITAVAVWILLLLAVVAGTSRAIAHPEALLIRYAGLAIGCVMLVVAWALAASARHRSTAGVWALGLIPLLAAAALTSPIALSSTIKNALTGGTVTPARPDPHVVRGLTPGLLAALLWLQNHTSVNTIFAVSNHWTDPEEKDGRYYYYSAFSERRVFVEAYDPIRFGITTGLATAAGIDFALRQRLNNDVFDDADTNALSILTQRYSVRYLFVDRVHGGYDPAVLQLGHVVYSNDQATIIVVG